MRVKASEVSKKRPIPALQPRLIDWATESWPVHERYEQRREADPLSGEARLRLVPGGRERVVQHPDTKEWIYPHIDPTYKGLFELLRPLAAATDDAIATWVEQRGLLGVHPGKSQRGETTAEIREAVSHYVTCARALDAAQRDSSKLRIALQLLQWPLGRYLTVRAAITEADGRAHLVPLITSGGYLAAAYQQLLGSASIQDAATRERYHWRQPRECERCGKLFSPKRRGGRFHNENCRKRAWDSNRLTA